MDGVQLLQDQNHLKEAVSFITLSAQKFLLLILSTSEGWKAEPPNDFEHKTPVLRIQHLNY